jgi:hypothetical protein
MGRQCYYNKVVTSRICKTARLSAITIAVTHRKAQDDAANVRHPRAAADHFTYSIFSLNGDPLSMFARIPNISIIALDLI